MQINIIQYLYPLTSPLDIIMHSSRAVIVLYTIIIVLLRFFVENAIMFVKTSFPRVNIFEPLSTEKLYTYVLRTSLYIRPSSSVIYLGYLLFLRIRQKDNKYAPLIMIFWHDTLLYKI